MGWLGPCPPPTSVPMSSARPTNTRDVIKRYTFKFFALDTEIDMSPDATKVDLLQAMDGHILAGGKLTGEQVGKLISVSSICPDYDMRDRRRVAPVSGDVRVDGPGEIGDAAAARLG
jgi:hypothetical protein